MPGAEIELVDACQRSQVRVSVGVSDFVIKLPQPRGRVQLAKYRQRRLHAAQTSSVSGHGMEAFSTAFSRLVPSHRAYPS